MPQIEHWSKMKERSGVIGIKILLALYSLFGRYVLKLVLYPIVAFYYWRSETSRQASLQYLERVANCYPAALHHKQPNHRMGIEHFHQFSLSAVDKIDGWVGKLKVSDIKKSGRHYFTSLIERKQGAIFIGSHLGNLELCRALSSGYYNVRINVLVFTAHAVNFNRLLKEINPDVDVNLIQVTQLGPDLAIMLKERIEQGEFLVIVGDRTSTSSAGKTKVCNFMGDKAHFPTGPFILSSLMECPVYLLFCLHKTDGYHLYVEPFAEEGLKFPRKIRDESIQQCIQNYAGRLEHHCSQAPLQWFNFFDFWAEDTSAVSR